MGQIVRGAKAGGGTNVNDGQTAVANDVNEDVNTLYTEVNGLLDDANIETGTLPGAKSLRFTNIADPGAPSSDDVLLYAKNDQLFARNDSGVVSLISGGPRGYLAGLGTVQAADADHDITVAAGLARDSTNVTDLVLAAAITKQLDVVWAVGTAAGGLDTGAIAATTWYAVWLIKRSDTAVVDVLFSTSFSAPTMPASYDYKRRIGAVLTDGSSAILDYSQTGDLVLWVTPILDLSGDTTEAATLRTLSVPPVAGIVAWLNVSADFTAPVMVYVSSPDQADQAPSGSASPLSTLGTMYTGGSNVLAGGPIMVRTNASKQVRTRTTGTLDGDGLNIATLGYMDRRGRDD